MFYVYVIESGKDGRLYKGMTDNIERRVFEHNSGKMKSTKGFLPWKLVYSEQFESREEARERKKYFKSGIGRQNLIKILAR